VGNAIKYRDSKRIPIIKIISVEEKGFIKLQVIDNGLGIDLEKNGDKLFEPFKRFHAHKEGRGLGLHLVKSELEAMGGTIEAKSEIGQGTTFTFYFQKGKT
jgi:signal transduction histidine kinase